MLSRTKILVAAVAVGLTVTLVLVVLAPSPKKHGKAKSVFGETLSTPVYGGVPGALPPGFDYVYNASLPGWPVSAINARHPIRGSFLDPRGFDDDGLSGYHFGIDINVDERHPDAGAPNGLSHRVYALDSGPARVRTAAACGKRHVEVGHFSYWHTTAIVRPGQIVRAGQQIGWSCRNYWHVHLSEWQEFQKARVWVNPLHPGGPLRLPPSAYDDRRPPAIHRLVFVTPPAKPWHPKRSLAEADTSTSLSPVALHGRVELRAKIDDPQSYFGFLKQNPAWPADFTPYRVAVAIRATNGSVVMKRVTFQADQLPQTPYLFHYAPGTVEAESMSECVGPPAHDQCSGAYWLRPFSRFKQEFWDTRKVSNGDYFVTVNARGIVGKGSSRTIRVTVHNQAAASSRSRIAASRSMRAEGPR